MRVRKTRHAKFLVAVEDDELFEVYDAAELVAWKSDDGVDVEYDQDRVKFAYRRTAESSWARIEVPTLVGLLEHEPGTRFWTKKTPPNYGDIHDEGWEAVQ